MNYRLTQDDLNDSSFEELFRLFEIKENIWIVGETTTAFNHLSSRSDLTTEEKDILFSFFPCHEDLNILFYQFPANTLMKEIATSICLIHYNSDVKFKALYTKWKNKEALSRADRDFFSYKFGSDIYIESMFKVIEKSFSSELKREVIQRNETEKIADFLVKKYEVYLFRLYRRRKWIHKNLENFSEIEKREIEKLLSNNEISEVSKIYLYCIWPLKKELQYLNALFLRYWTGQLYGPNLQPSLEELIKIRAIQNFYNFLSSGLGDRPRLYLQDIQSLSIVNFIGDDVVDNTKNGYIDVSEDEVQTCIEKLLGVNFHKKDWGGEENDLYASQLKINHINGCLSAAFLLKGNGLKKRKMEITDCGKNGDQLVRLFQSPAEMFVIQYVGNISENLIKDVESKVMLRRKSGKLAWYCIIDGKETAKLLHFCKR